MGQPLLSDQHPRPRAAPYYFPPSPPKLSQQYHNCDTATMGRLKPCRSDNEREKSIRLAKQDFINGIEPSIRSAARTYNIPFTTLRDCLRGQQSHSKAHQELQLLSVQEEKAIVRFFETLDDRGHPVTIKILKQFAQSLLPR